MDGAGAVFEYLFKEEPEQEGGCDDEGETPPAVGGEKGGPVRQDGVVQDFGNPAAVRGIVRSLEREQRLARQGEEKAEPGSDSGGGQNAFPAFLVEKLLRIVPNSACEPVRIPAVKMLSEVKPSSSCTLNLMFCRKSYSLMSEPASFPLSV